MKKLFILGLASVLAITACNSGNGGNSTSASENNGSEGVANSLEFSGQIAYINIDSLMSGYNLYIDLAGELEKKATEVENDLNSRGRSFERDVAAFQTNYEKGLMTRSEAAAKQQELEQRQQQLYQHSETRQRELAEENQVMMNKLVVSLEDFIEEFNSDYRYSMILTTSGNTPILHADPRLDITAVVLSGLNEEYAKSKGTK